MRRSSPQLKHSTRATLLALGALLGSDCVGTPLPEPPDELPRPEFTAFSSVPITVVGMPNMDAALLPVDVRIAAPSGAVSAGARVWAINLDAAGQAPVEQPATALGGFALTIRAAANDRVRIVARSARQHSAPLDLVVTVLETSPMMLTGVTNLLRSTQLACLQVTPGETLRLSGKRGTLMLRNQCAGPVAIERAALRLGDQGIALMPPPATLAAGEQAVLTLTDSQGPGESERLDVLLLDVGGPDGLEGRYAIDVFSALD